MSPMSGELMIIQIQEFLKNESLTTNFADIQKVHNMLWRMVFLSFLSQSVPSRGSWKPKSSSKRVSTGFATIPSLNFDETWQNGLGPWRMESYQFLRLLSRSEIGARNVPRKRFSANLTSKSMWKISTRLGLKLSGNSSLSFKLDVCFQK